MNEWGLTQTPASSTASTETYTLVGGGLGVLLGGLAGAMMKHTAIGAVAGGMIGAGGGYYFASRPPASTATGTTT